MSDKKLLSDDGDNKGVKSNLPSWMSSKEKGGNPRRKKHVDTDKGEVASNMSTPDFSELLEGVVLVLSGFINPERGILRSQALEMGAEYRADWTSDCTLLICAFPNTPKFRQVEADCGTIVSKEWLLECHKQKTLVEIDRFLMHAGKPWRKSNCHAGVQEHEKLPGKSHERTEKRSHPRLIGSTISEGEPSNPARVYLSPSKVKEWAMDDLNKTILWLDSQEEKPEPSELKKIAGEGILTCLEDAIMALKENQDIRHVTEQWKFVPRVVRELAKLEDGNRSLSKEELSKQAITCRRVYKLEFENEDTIPAKDKRLKRSGSNDYDCEKTEIRSDDAGFDSDETIVMTEEEIHQACRGLSSMH